MIRLLVKISRQLCLPLTPDVQMYTARGHGRHLKLRHKNPFMKSLMPWDARNTLSLRTEFDLFASQDGPNTRSLCRHYGMSPATGYKWLQRWAQGGQSGLPDRPRIPHHSPNRSSDDITALQRMAHDRHEHWGACKIKHWLEDQGHRIPAFSTVHSLMARHGLLRGLHRAFPAGAASNHLWQI